MWVFDRKKLTERRTELGLSMERLAAICEFKPHHTTISKIENQKRSLSVEILGRLATALKVSPNYFFYNKKQQ